MKKIIKWLLLICLFIHPIAVIHTAIQPVSAQEELKNFFMLTPKAGDDSVSGEGYPNHRIMLEIEDVTYEEETTEDGTFEFENIEILEEGQFIQITQGNNTIDTLVVSEDSKTEHIELEEPFDFEGMNETVDDNTSEATDETDNKGINDPLDSDRSTDESLDGDIEDKENDDSQSIEERDEAPLEESNLNEDEITEITPFSNRVLATSPASPGDNIPEDRTAYVSDFNALRTALESSTIEKIKLTENIQASNTSNITIRSTANRIKVIDGQGHELHFNSSGAMNAASNIDHLVIKNFSDISKADAAFNRSLVLFSNNAYHIHIDNVNYNNNGNNVETFVSAQNSEIHIYNNVNINTYTASNVFQSHLITIHDYANLNVETDGNFNTVERFGALNSVAGLNVGENAIVNISAQGSIVYARPYTTSGVIGVLFDVSQNSQVNLESGSHAFYITDLGIRVNIAPNSNVDLNSNQIGIYSYSVSTAVEYTMNIAGNLVINADTGLGWRNAEFNLDVYDNGKLEINSQVNSISKNSTSGSNPNFTIRDGGEFIAQNQSSSNPVFQIAQGAVFNIDTPELVDFVSNSSLILSNSATFNIELLNVNGWHNQSNENDPDVQSGFIEQTTFSLSQNSINHEAFPDEFRSGLTRIQFETRIKPPEIDPISDLDTEITGSALENAVVEMFNENGELIDSVETNNEGEFEFILDEPFKVATKLQFRTRKFSSLFSEYTETTVKGVRLELLSIDDVIFQTTEINHQPDQMIPKTENQTIRILDTRENSNWSLSLIAQQPMTSNSGDQLTNALYFNNDTTDQQLIESQSINIASKNDALLVEEFEYQLEWDVDDGLVMITNPIYAQSDTEYSTTLQWTLSDAPS